MTTGTYPTVTVDLDVSLDFFKEFCERENRIHGGDSQRSLKELYRVMRAYWSAQEEGGTRFYYEEYPKK